MGERHVMVIRHLSRPDLEKTADNIAQELRSHGITPVDETYSGAVEIVIALGGDGTLLGAARYARAQAVPLIGINLGHTGFLTEVEPDRISEVIDHIVAGSYT
ncbi:MAG: NAD(+)/NADH kinase, partial [Varibaculum cambriense]|nr:NAD(+)/NADH kinase [Varibaculum cambriense]